MKQLSVYSHLGMQNIFYRLLDICLKNMSFSKLLIPMCCKPDASKWAFFGQHKMCIKHGGSQIVKTH